MNKKYFFTYFSLFGGKKHILGISPIFTFFTKFSYFFLFFSTFGHIFSTLGYFKNYFWPIFKLNK